MATNAGTSSTRRTPVGGTRKGSWLSLLVILFCVWLAAGVGGLFTRSGVAEWYPTLSKPSWRPPDWLFGPVWALLYGSMVLAAWMVWLQRRRTPVFAAIIAFGCQLSLNAAWPALFFALRNPLAALVEIIILWGAVVITIALFWRVRPVAAVLLVPYGLWVTFAACLNFAIWRLNA